MKYILAMMAIALAVYYYNRICKGKERVLKLIYFELIYNLIIKFIIGNLGLPSVLNYVTDFVLIWIVIEYFHEKRYKKLYVPKSLMFCVSILILISVISFVLNLYSPLLYLWGFRNNFRFLIFAIMCAVYLKKEDIADIINMLYGFFLLNIVVVTYQAFFVSYSQTAKGDFISGLYSNGMERGGNASLNWLMCIVCTYYIVRFLNKETSIFNMLIAIAGSMYMSTVAEIKIFYIQILLIGIISLLICRKSFKTIGFVIVGAVVLMLGIRAFYILFPNFADFFNAENILDYVTRDTGYGSAGSGTKTGIDRLTAISFVLDNFLKDPIQKLFGVGLGNADYSSFSFLTSTFYSENSWSGYQFFYSSFITIEMGLVGLVSYLIVILNYFKNAVQFKSKAIEEKSIKQFVVIISLICFLMIFSNQTMKIEASGYLVHCMLVLPYILMKPENDLQKNKFNIKNQGV